MLPGLRRNSSRKKMRLSQKLISVPGIQVTELSMFWLDSIISDCKDAGEDHQGGAVPQGNGEHADNSDPGEKPALHPASAGQYVGLDQCTQLYVLALEKGKPAMSGIILYTCLSLGSLGTRGCCRSRGHCPTTCLKEG